MVSMSEALASTFVWKHDDSVDRKCQQLASLAKAFIMTAFVVLGALAAPEGAPPVLHYEQVFSELTLGNSHRGCRCRWGR